MTAAGFRKQLVLIELAAKLPFPIHPHMLRHVVSGRPRPRWTRHGRWTGDRGAEVAAPGSRAERQTE